MPEISLTDFVDFVTRSGSPKLTKVRQIRNREEYDPIRDFWKELREGLVRFHAGSGDDKQDLDALIDATLEARQDHYREAIKGYKRFLGRKSVQWFEPPRITWYEGDLGIRINPELGLTINGVPTVIKVHFKSRQLTKRRIECILLLMEDALRPHCGEDVRFAVLDCWKGKLFYSEDPRWKIRPYLIGEARAFSTMWTELARMERTALEAKWGRPELNMSSPPA
ncbi:MAG: hypothetical protein H6739_24945 [Alphaproteobacteria bacterium]|nr:hypothetical protein [Alphaproteobacteria bacterium]